MTYKSIKPVRNAYVYLLILLFAAGILASGCKKDNKEVVFEATGTFPANDDIPIPAFPIHLKADTTKIILSDIFLHPEKVKSARWNEGETILDNKELTLLTNQAQIKPLSILTFEHEDHSYDLLVINDSAFNKKERGIPVLSGSDESNGDLLVFSCDPRYQANIFVFWNNHLLTPATKEGGRFEVIIPMHLGGSMIRVYAYNGQGLADELMVPVKDGKVITDPSELDRNYYRSNIMYFTFVDRFKNGDKSNDWFSDDKRVPDIADFNGGDIAGITQKINDGYFRDLSVSALWISPITQNPWEAYREYPEPRRWYTGYHGYWPISSSKIDTRFGNDASFKSMVSEAHDKEMNVFLDYVCNHVHKKHPIYQNHAEWATQLELDDGTMNIRIWDDQRLTTWFDTFLPTLDLSNDEVIEVQSDSALYWIKEFDLDGFRHDATKHIPVKFWRTLTRKLRDEVVIPENRPIYQIGETYADDQLIADYIQTGLLDAQFDFNLYFTARDAFALRQNSLMEVARSLKESLEIFGEHHLMGNITGNHDQVRFMGLASGAVAPGEDDKEAGYQRQIRVIDQTAYKRLHMMAAFTYSIPGIPVVYYGDEIGMVGAGDPDNRRMMRFEELEDKESETLEVFKKLGEIRSGSMALMYGQTEVDHVSNDHMVLRRSYLGEEVLIVFNKGLKKFSRSFDGVNWQTNFDGEWEVEGDKTKVTIGPESFEILTLKS
jgi:glycosidase